MGKFEGKLPAIAMASLQFTGAIMSLLGRSVLVKGMSPRVFIFYRQMIATLVISPIAYFSRVKSPTSSSMGIKAYTLIFATAFIGTALNMNFYFEGLYLSSASTASAMANLIPAVTFLLAASLGMEQVDLRRFSSVAKILGTCFCVGGAVSMALLRGPKLLNAEILPQRNSITFPLFGGADQSWLPGCLFLFASCLCWSSWLTLQVPLTRCCPDHLTLSAWMCLFSTIQTGIIAFLLERESGAWALRSTLELVCCLYAGVFGSAVQFFVQSWCISLRGPLFSAMFSPLNTVITTLLACLLLHEEMYIGSLVGGVTVIIGLYIVLWGKGEEVKHKLGITGSDQNNDTTCSTKDLEQPFLEDTSITKTDLVK